MSKWTTEQDAIIAELANKGAAAVRDVIYRRTGVYRSVNATERRASRIGVSLVRYEVCPMCGRVTRRLYGAAELCEACNKRELARKYRERMRTVEVDETNRANKRDIETVNARREFDRLRQAGKRARAKHVV